MRSYLLKSSEPSNPQNPQTLKTLKTIKTAFLQYVMRNRYCIARVGKVFGHRDFGQGLGHARIARHKTWFWVPETARNAQNYKS